MRYELASGSGNLKPRAALALANLGETTSHHQGHGLRPPLAIFNVSFNEVIAKLTVLLDHLENANERLPHLDPKEKGWDQRLLDAQDHVLDALMQHLDSYKSIICCFYEDCGSKSAQKILRSLNRDIRSYRDHVAKIVNLIKHKQRRLSTVFFHDPGIYCIGYYVEGVLLDGAIGPDPEVHRGSNVAISFNRDLPFHICNLYSCSAALATAIYQVSGAKPAPTTAETKSDKELVAVLRRVSALPMLFFPDEVRKPNPVVRYVPDRRSNAVRVILEMPSRRFRPRTIPAGCRIQTTWCGDGVSRTFKAPYFGKDAPNNRRLQADAAKPRG